MLFSTVVACSALVFDAPRINVGANAAAISARSAPASMVLGGLMQKKDGVASFAGNVAGKVVPTAGATFPPITEAEVRTAQANWANAIKTISKTYLEDGDFVAAAGQAAGELYGYGHSNVLFKPTKAKDVQFRPMANDAMSYFVGAGAVEDGIAEDGGFAINGGKGWADVVFDNHQIDLNDNTAIAMGNYYFTCATTGEKAQVEYTFGYKRCTDGKVRIFLHHSSVPFSPSS